MANGPAVHRDGDTLLVGFRVSPSAARTAVKGLYGDRVKVAVSAPPEGGKANAALVEALAAWLGLSRDAISVKTGVGSRDKVVAFRGVDEGTLAARLLSLLQNEPRRK